MDINWDNNNPLQVFDARDRLGTIIDTVDPDSSDWVVLKRPDNQFYAYRPQELWAFAQQFPGTAPLSAVDALGLHEYQSSAVLWPQQSVNEVSVPATVSQPSMLRVVRVDSTAEPLAVGQFMGWDGQVVAPFDVFQLHTASARPDLGADLGPTAPHDVGAEPPERGGEEAAPTVDVVISGKAPSRLAVQKQATITIRLETEEGATPLDRSISNISIEKDKEVVAALSVDSTKIEVAGDVVRRLQPPLVGQPSLARFTVVGKAPGATSVDVRFSQGSSDLGTLTFPIKVARTVVRPQRTTARITATPPDPRDNDYLVLQIIELPVGNNLSFIFLVTSGSLGLENSQFQSRPFDATAASGGSATLAYVNSIYDRIEHQVLDTFDDFTVFDIKLTAISTDMSDQLFDPDFIRTIWDRRDQIRGVKIYSREPYIPWELVRLRHPEKDEVDERYLCEYGLVRNLGGAKRPIQLKRDSWAYLVGNYPNKTQDELTKDAAFMSTTLQQRGIHPTQIEPSEKALLVSLKAGDFDVLHITCHGESDPATIDDARLIISDRQTVRQGVQPVAIDSLTVQRTAKLSKRTPLVFLNACQSGRQGPSLTRLGGWPAAFWSSGAGAFVGTSWSVHEGPASTFVQTFYTALLDGSTIGDAATKARTEARKIGDASWLSYVIYGDPKAQFV
jgi:hypothetical protein